MSLEIMKDRRPSTSSSRTKNYNMEFKTLRKEIKKMERAVKRGKMNEIPVDSSRRIAVKIGIHGGESDLKTKLKGDDDPNVDSWLDMVDIPTLHSVAKSEIKNNHHCSALRILNRVS